MLTSLTLIWEHTGRISNYNYDRQLQVKFFVAEEWRAQNAVDSLRAGLISSIDTERVGAVWIEYRDQSQSG
jgi:hypothetical protein